MTGVQTCALPICGNFLRINALEAFNVIEGLVGIPPINDRKIEIDRKSVV